MLSAKSALVNQSIHVYVYVLVKKRKLLIILFFSILFYFCQARKISDYRWSVGNKN